jgi:hypothetical protein
LFALSSPQLIFVPDEDLPARGTLSLYRIPTGAPVQDPGVHAGSDLSDDAARLGLPTSGVEATVHVGVPTDGGPAVLELPALELAIGDSLGPLLALATRPRGWRRPPDSVRGWAQAAHVAVRLVAGHRIVPTLRQTPDGRIHGVWRALLEGDPEARSTLDRLAEVMPCAGWALARDAATVWAPNELLAAFCDAVADVAVRAGGPPPRPGRPRERLLPWTARWAEAVSDPVDAAVPLGDDGPDLVAGVTTWLATGDTVVAAVELLLDAPSTQQGPWVLRFGVRTAGGALVGAEAIWADTDDTVADDVAPAALREPLLRGLARCSRVFPPLDAALREQAPDRITLDLDQAWSLIHEVGPLLDGTDLALVVSEDVAVEGLQLRARLDGGDAGDGGDDLEDPGPDGLPAVDQLDGGWLVEDGGAIDFRWEIAVDGEALDDEAVAALLDARAPLVRWRDRWVHVNPETVQGLARFTGGGQLPLAEALAFALAGGAPLDALAPDLPSASPDWPCGGGAVPVEVEVVAAGRLGSLLDRIQTAGQRPLVPVTPDGFVGELRPYQRRGVSWLAAMGDLGLGAVLADDMGLGKSIELIAHLLGRRDRGRPGPWLVVCPTSVVGNWEREIHRFAPDLAVTRFHGPERPEDLRGVTGVVLTTYGVLRRAAEPLTAVIWDVLALDEAQHVKNPTTAGARAVRTLRARQRLALTGTPLENRLDELWSLLDATNPGLLGRRGQFTRRFVTPIEKRGDARTAGRLRRLVAPFILRREKSDPTVISDLPDKIERTVVCGLTPEQASLYQQAVDAAFGSIEADASAIERRGRILALLTRLKQICNHPAQHLGEPAHTRLLGRSGKLAVAREIVGTAVESGDQVLVFTQYVEMGRLLVAQLEADLGVEVPFLHGGVAAGSRDRMVAGFQGETPDAEPAPVLVVSLRAGGTGLNLTAATHVVHYDRWWNPAVEDQATDRAHRIGQRRTVEVHKLVTAGTVEERVADLLERKRALADAVVGAGERWITELSDAELRDLVTLSSAAVEELDDDADGVLGGDDRLLGATS